MSFPVQVITMDKMSAAGNIKFSENALGIESLSNFSSARASACVFKGKWMYEVTLGTAGIQQLGWATTSCPFTNEEGVGDAVDSYAFDGKRRKKWNVNCTQYGENWAAGDVIGCYADLDKGEISFSRNGNSLGTAFSNVRTAQKGMAYFPAISLSHNERCEVNFGSRPMAYPSEEFSPLQDPPPKSQRRAASYLTGCLVQIARFSGSPEPDPNQVGSRQMLCLSTDDAVLLGSLVAERLGPMMHNEFLVHEELVPCLLQIHRKVWHPPVIQ